MHLPQIALSVMSFLQDPVLFAWPPDQRLTQLQALAQILEQGLQAMPGSFAFLWGGAPIGVASP